MFSAQAGQPHKGEPMFCNGFANAAAISEAAPVCLDPAATSGSTAADGDPIEAHDAVGAYFARPTTAVNLKAFLGVAKSAIAQGGFDKATVWGPCEVLVNNPDAASLTLGVGDLLYASASGQYLIPYRMPVSAGTSRIIVPRGAMPRAMVTVGKTLTAGQTAKTRVWLFPPGGPRLLMLSAEVIPGAAPATQTAVPLGVALGHGIIPAVGFGVATGGGAGTLTLDVLINGTTIFTTTPIIDNDCTDPFHNFAQIDAPGASAGPGTNGRYGLVNTAANIVAPGDRITRTLTNTSSFAGTHVNIQVPILYFG